MNEKSNEVVLGVDPGGASGTLGCVLVAEWERRHGMWLPVELLEVASVAGLEKGALYVKALLEDYPVSRVACEDVRIWEVRNADVLTTIQQVGMVRLLTYMSTSTTVRSLDLVVPSTWRSWWFGTKVKNPDGALDQELLRLYGGPIAAIGGARCEKCGGKGRRGRALSSVSLGPALHEELLEVGGKWYRKCLTCDGAGSEPKGPLWSLWKPRSIQHARVAMGVAICAKNGGGAC